MGSAHWNASTYIGDFQQRLKSLVRLLTYIYILMLTVMQQKVFPACSKKSSPRAEYDDKANDVAFEMWKVPVDAKGSLTLSAWEAPPSTSQAAGDVVPLTQIDALPVTPMIAAAELDKQVVGQATTQTEEEADQKVSVCLAD